MTEANIQAAVAKFEALIREQADRNEKIDLVNGFRRQQEDRMKKDFGASAL